MPSYFHYYDDVQGRFNDLRQQFLELKKKITFFLENRFNTQETNVRLRNRP